MNKSKTDEKELNYEQTHPEYDASIGDYTKHWALYQGGKSVEQGGELVQHPHESPKQFEVRKRRATYKNYCAPVVDLFATSVTDGVKRSGLEKDGKPVNDTVARIMKDCDRSGKEPDAFFKEAATFGAARGAHFVVVDMPAGDGTAKTAKDAKSQGLFPYLVHVPAVDLISWGFGGDGKLNYVVIKTEAKGSEGPFKPFTSKTVITLWTREGWSRYSKGNKGAYTLDDNGKHHLGEVPVVPFLYEPVTAMTGKTPKKTDTVGEMAAWRQC